MLPSALYPLPLSDAGEGEGQMPMQRAGRMVGQRITWNRNRKGKGQRAQEAKGTRTESKVETVCRRSRAQGEEEQKRGGA